MIMRTRLLENSTRPTIEIYGARAFIDTGAMFPIADISDEDITNIFGGTLLNANGKVSGIGGEGSPAHIYRIKHFAIGNIEFENIPMATADLSRFSIRYIIPASMFGPNSIITIDRAKMEFKVNMPEMTYLSKKLWACESGEWKLLDYENGSWVFMVSDLNFPKQ